MIAWDQIKPIITSQISTLADIPPSSVRWVDEPSGLVDGALPLVWLRVSSVVAVGCEEERLSDPGSGLDPQTPNICGVRYFTLSIRCESFTSDISDPLYAGNIADRIKIRLWRSTAREQRNHLFAIADYSASKWFSYIADGRQINAFVTDLSCITVDNDTDDSVDSGSWIGEALVSGPVKDTSGSTLGTVNDDANAKP